MRFAKLGQRFQSAFDVERLTPAIVPVGVKFIAKGQQIPRDFEGDDIPTPWCGAVKLASEGSSVMITQENIGCPAGASGDRP